MEKIIINIRGDKERIKWLNAFYSALNLSDLPIPGFKEDLDILKQDLSAYVHLVEKIEEQHYQLSNQAEYKNIITHGQLDKCVRMATSGYQYVQTPNKVAPGIFRRICRLIEKIKTHPEYNSTYANNLGLTGHEKLFEYCYLKPELSYNYDHGRPLLKWKKEKSELIEIHADRRDGNGFNLLAITSGEEYLDTFHLEEGIEEAVWDYVAAFLNNDYVEGRFSQTISVPISSKNRLLHV